MEAGSFPSRFPTLNLMVKVWDTVKTLLGYRGFTGYAPSGRTEIWERARRWGQLKEWERCGIKFINQLNKEDILKSFQELREYAISNK